jgi:hypothetical protein
MTESLPTSMVPPGRSLFGVWEEYQIDLSLEDLAEVRHEMWKSFPRCPRNELTDVRRESQQGGRQ